MATEEAVLKLGKKIQTVRQANGITVLQLAKNSGKEEWYILGLEAGSFDPFMLDMIDVIKGLGVTLPDFFEGFEDSPIDR